MKLTLVFYRNVLSLRLHIPRRPSFERATGYLIVRWGGPIVALQPICRAVTSHSPFQGVGPTSQVRSARSPAQHRPIERHESIVKRTQNCALNNNFSRCCMLCCVRKCSCALLQTLMCADTTSSRGRGYPRRPLTPPYVRFRIRRFMNNAGGAAEYRAAKPAPRRQTSASGRPHSYG